MVAHDLVDRMLSFEPYLSTPSLSKDAAQNSAYFFRLCFTSFFRLFRAQNESYEAEIISNNQPDAGERGDVLTVGFGGRWIERPSAEAPMVGDERKGVREVMFSGGDAGDTVGSERIFVPKNARRHRHF